jgi:hypothetical protein
LWKIVRHLGSGISWAQPCQRIKNDSAAILSEGNGLSEQKSDAKLGKTVPFPLLIGGKLGIERQNWTMSDFPF